MKEQRFRKVVEWEEGHKIGFSLAIFILIIGLIPFLINLFNITKFSEVKEVFSIICSILVILSGTTLIIDSLFKRKVYWIREKKKNEFRKNN